MLIIFNFICFYLEYRVKHVCIGEGGGHEWIKDFFLSTDVSVYQLKSENFWIICILVI